MMASLPPISTTTRLIQICPGWGFAANSLMRSPTSFEPVKDTKRVLGCWTSTSPTTDPLPTRSEKERSGKPASRSTSANLAAMVGVSLEGFITTVLPVTSAAMAMPTRIASGKFQGGITTPTPSGT